jgi:hypothetical protein
MLHHAGLVADRDDDVAFRKLGHTRTISIPTGCLGGLIVDLGEI